MNDPITDIWKAGAFAFKAGTPLDENPYKENFTAEGDWRDQWQQGWLDAEKHFYLAELEREGR